MSFSNSLVTNKYRPDRRILDALTALTQRVEALETEKTAIRAENAELLIRLEALQLWASTLVLYEDGRWIGVDSATPLIATGAAACTVLERHNERLREADSGQRGR